MRTKEEIIKEADESMSVGMGLRQGHIIIELLCDIRDERTKRIKDDRMADFTKQEERVKDNVEKLEILNARPMQKLRSRRESLRCSRAVHSASIINLIT